MLTVENINIYVTSLAQSEISKLISGTLTPYAFVAAVDSEDLQLGLVVSIMACCRYLANQTHLIRHPQCIISTPVMRSVSALVLVLSAR